MKKELVIVSDEWETIGAIVEDKRIVELFFERKPASAKIGNVYLGKVKDVLPGIEAAFIDIGHEKNAFLFFYDKPAWLSEADTAVKPETLRRGQHVIVQLVKHAMSGKGARVMTNIGIAGRFIVYLPYSPKVGISRKLPDHIRNSIKKEIEPLIGHNNGFIVRTAAGSATIKQIRNELISLRKIWSRVMNRAKRFSPPTMIYDELPLELRLVRDQLTPDFDRVVVENTVIYKSIKNFLERRDPKLLAKLEFDEEGELHQKYKIKKTIEEASSRVVSLRSGGYIAIDHTEALTAIDVNTGRYIGKRLEETILKTNFEAATEIARQLRLRDIGGIIVIDFIGMTEERNKEKLFNRFQKAVENDRSKNYIVKLSPLGLIEMTRKSVSESPIDFFFDSCSYCGGTGYVISAETSAINVRRKISELCKKGTSRAFLIKIHPIVSAEMGVSQGDRIKDLDTKKDVFVLLDSHIPVDEIRVVQTGSIREIIKALQFYPAGQRQLT